MIEVQNDSNLLFSDGGLALNILLITLIVDVILKHLIVSAMYKNL
jgi:hypothetical protein